MKKCNYVFKCLSTLVSILAFELLTITVALAYEQCEGYEVSKDTEIKDIYRLVIDQLIVDCVSNGETSLRCGSRNVTLWGDAINKILGPSSPVSGDFAMLTDVKGQRFFYRYAGYFDYNKLTLPRFSDDCSIMYTHYSPMLLRSFDGSSRDVVILWVRRYSTYRPTTVPEF